MERNYMTQTEIIVKLNSIYSNLNLVEVKDRYSTYDAENESYIVEVKSRDKKYRSWAIEKKKFDSNIDKAVETGKMFVYLTEYKGDIMTWNINNLVLTGYDFQWTKIPMPQTTEFEDTKTVTKEVGFLYEGVAKIHKDKD
tara:strand:- start:60 stop:479 length:420 start_codon:yes stop_codon:yes gene_type:complete